MGFARPTKEENKIDSEQFHFKVYPKAFEQIHFHRNRVQEIMQKQETLNAIECQ